MQRLGKPWYRRRALQVFRDDTSLSATPHLWPSIETAARQIALSDLARLAGGGGLALGRSRNRLLARPQQRRQGVDCVDRRGARLGRSDRRFSLVDDDTASDALKNRFTSEPRWIDLRPYRDRSIPNGAAFLGLGAEFAAAIRGTPKEDLLSQEVRQQAPS